MTSLTQTAGAPVYVASHPHPLADVVAYDVIRTAWQPDGDLVSTLTVTVTDVVGGATRYADALDLARAHRTGPGAYGYVSHVYRCGCRAIAGVSALRFADHPAYALADAAPVVVTRTRCFHVSTAQGQTYGVAATTRRDALAMTADRLAGEGSGDAPTGARFVDYWDAPYGTVLHY